MGLADRPRERMQILGPRALSDAELLAVIVGSGKRGLSALDLARQILRAVGNDLNELARGDLQDFTQHQGMGKVKALRLMASLELGRRRNYTVEAVKPQLGNSETIFNYLWKSLGDLQHEELHLLCLNRGHRLLGAHRVSQGGVTGTVADAKIIFRKVLSHASATSIVLAHNHPSGQAFPSRADILMTQKMVAAARHLDLQVLDHLIIAGRQYYSFADNGILSGPEEA